MQWLKRKKSWRRKITFRSIRKEKLKNKKKWGQKNTIDYRKLTLTGCFKFTFFNKKKKKKVHSAFEKKKFWIKNWKKSNTKINATGVEERKKENGKMLTLNDQKNPKICTSNITDLYFKMLNIWKKSGSFKKRSRSSRFQKKYWAQNEVPQKLLQKSWIRLIIHINNFHIIVEGGFTHTWDFYNVKPANQLIELMCKLLTASPSQRFMQDFIKIN